MKTRCARSLFTCFLGLSIAVGSAQEQTGLTLSQTVDMAKRHSIAAKQAATARETRYWEFRNVQSNYRPQLLLDSRVPSFVRSFSEVVQPDGNILFQPVRNNNSSVGLSLEQNIAGTGGTVYATTQFQRFDDFSRNTTLYNGTLFAVGFEQPLLRFNPMKWERRIAPLRYRESQQEYLENMEQIAVDGNNLFFDLLLAQVNRNIAETNFRTTTDILRIAEEKFDLGKISRNEILQLQLEQLKAEKAVAAAKREVEIATLQLKAFTGLALADSILLEEPLPLSMPDIDPDRALTEALANRVDPIAFGRRLLEAEREVARARGERGVNAALTASLGFSNRGEQVGDLYRQPQDQQLIALTLTVPVLDWGRSESRIRTATANQQLVQYTLEQDQQNFRQQIYTEVTLFSMLKEQLSLTARADSIASEKYQIARERYVLGNLGITDLSIAFSEKDQARRDFIGSLRDYWSAYYRLRLLTLYDFERHEKINYP